MKSGILIFWCLLLLIPESAVSKIVGRKPVEMGLGVTYFQALRHSIQNRTLLKKNLSYLKDCGVDYIRVVAMIKDDGSGTWPVEREIIPDSKGYWEGFRYLLDETWRSGLRVQITIFTSTASMKNMGSYEELRDFTSRVFRDIINTKDGTGVFRSRKVIMIELANEWYHPTQNLKEEALKKLTLYTRRLLEKTGMNIPVSVSAPEEKSIEAINKIYSRDADVVTFHFSRRTDLLNGWEPVVDCEDIYRILASCDVGVIPVSSNEPVGPGASIMSETRADRLVMAAAYAWSMELPMYVYHCAAGVGIDLKVPEVFSDKLMPGLRETGILRKLLSGEFINSVDRGVFDISEGKAVRIRGRAIGKDVWTLIPGAADLVLKSRVKLDSVDVYDPWTMKLLFKNLKLNQGGILDLKEWEGDSFIIRARIVSD